MTVTRDRFVLAFGGSIDAAADRATARVDVAMNRLAEAVATLKAIGGADGPLRNQLDALAARRDAILASAEPMKAKYDKLLAVEKEAGVQAQAAEAAARKRAHDADEGALTASLKAAMAAGDTAAIDGMVAKFGGKVSDADNRKVLKAAFKARYDLDEVSGDMTAKALPRLYQILGMVPASHTTGNDSLKAVRRSQKLGDVPKGSLYTPAQKAIDINVPGTSIPWSRKGADGTRTWFEAFTLATLHEIGHSVDDKLRFMGSSAGDGRFGGWKDEDPQSIAEKAATHPSFGLQQDFAGLKVSWLTKYLADVLETGSTPKPDAYIASSAGDIARAQADHTALDDALRNRDMLAIEGRRAALVRDGAPEEDFAAEYERRRKKPPRVGGGTTIEANLIRRVLAKMLQDGEPLADAVDSVRETLEPVPDALSAADLKRLAAHPVIAWCKSLRARGAGSGAWDSGPSGAGKAQLGGRVYQQSYPTSWCSYNLSSRAKGVSDYQFRAAGEWFAELYAFYYLGKLSQSHPDYGWMTDRVHNA